MPKVNTIVPHEPQLVLWGKPRVRGSTVGGTIPASESEHRIRKHPKVTWLCVHFETLDTTTKRPDNPDFTGFSQLSYEKKAARRIREHAQDQITLGWEPEFLHFFIQRFAMRGPSGGTPALFRSDTDASFADGTKWNTVYDQSSIYTKRAEEGPLNESFGFAIPIKEASESLRDEIKSELEANNIDPLGYWTDDCENLHEPWRWCRRGSNGGSWNLNVSDERYRSETIIDGIHRTIGPAVDFTLDKWIDDCKKYYAPGFAPVVNQDVSSSQNISLGNTRELHRLRVEASQSQYARVTKDIWKQEPFWQNLKTSNYDFYSVDNPKFPIHMKAGGSAPGEHISNYFGNDISCVSSYTYNDSDGNLVPGMKRFSPRQRFGPGRLYDECQSAAIIRRHISAHKMSSKSSSIPCSAWIRGMDDGTYQFGRVPSPTVEDFVRTIRQWASYDKCEFIVIWYDNRNNDDVRYDLMLEGIEQVYPQWVWDVTRDDWVDRNRLSTRQRVEGRRLEGNFEIVPDEPVPVPLSPPTPPADPIQSAGSPQGL